MIINFKGGIYKKSVYEYEKTCINCIKQNAQYIIARNLLQLQIHCKVRPSMHYKIKKTIIL